MCFAIEILAQQTSSFCVIFGFGLSPSALLFLTRLLFWKIQMLLCLTDISYKQVTWFPAVDLAKLGQNGINPYFIFFGLAMK